MENGYHSPQTCFCYQDNPIFKLIYSRHGGALVEFNKKVVGSLLL